MTIRRLATAEPGNQAFGSGTSIHTASADTLASVIVVNKASQDGYANVYIIPDGSELVEAEWAIVAYNLKISGYNTYETFRFAMNASDSLHVAGSADLAYFLQGTTQ
jgi:hypothetical protein